MAHTLNGSGQVNALPIIVEELFFKQTHGKRFADLAALHFIAAKQAQQVRLLLRLDTLRYHSQIECMRKFNDEFFCFTRACRS